MFKTTKTCFHQKFFHSHQCFQTSYKEKKCVLCHEDLFSSQEESFSIPCSHFIHMKCFKEYISYGNFTCPQCKKTLYDISKYMKSISICLTLKENISTDKYLVSSLLSYVQQDYINKKIIVIDGSENPVYKQKIENALK